MTKLKRGVKLARMTALLATALAGCQGFPNDIKNGDPFLTIPTHGEDS